MKRFLYLAAIACMIFCVSCEKDGVSHTGDNTGKLYGIWALTTKTEVFTNSEGKETTTETDYTDNHFYLALSEFPIPHAIAKKGSFTDADLKDVDVKAGTFTYNSDLDQISFTKIITLTDEHLTRSMILSGTFDVITLNDTDLAIKQKSKLTGVTTTYAYKKQK